MRIPARSSIHLCCLLQPGTSRGANLWTPSEQKAFSTSNTRPLFRLPSASSLVAQTPSSVQPYLRLMRADKPIGTWLLYWPCTWSIALATPAGQLPSLSLLALFGAGSFFMRSAGCVINDLWDKDFDRQVERTRLRPLASGALSTTQAMVLLSGLLSTSLGILMQLNWFSVAVGASSMLLVVAYPLAKRYTYWPQLVLGATLNWGVLIAWAHMLPVSQFHTVLPLYIATCLHTIIYDTIYSHQKFPIQFILLATVVWLCLNWIVLEGSTFNWGALLGWSAVQGNLAPAALALYMAGIQWTLVYDTIYAHQDKADDIMIGLKSTALRFGDDTKKWLSAFSTVSILSLFLAGQLAEQTWPYYASLAATAAHLAWQVGTVNTASTEDCWKKFRSNQWLGAILFFGIIAGNLLKEEEKGNVDEDFGAYCD